jgi:hypothetical protein
MRRVSTRALVLCGLAVVLLLAGVVSFYASRHPDGLQYVAHQTGFATTAEPHVSDGSPFAGYAFKGIHDARLSRGLAGIAGVVVTAVLAAGLFLVLRRRGSHDAEGTR